MLENFIVGNGNKISYYFKNILDINIYRKVLRNSENN